MLEYRYMSRLCCDIDAYLDMIYAFRLSSFKIQYHLFHETEPNITGMGMVYFLYKKLFNYYHANPLRHKENCIKVNRLQQNIVCVGSSADDAIRIVAPLMPVIFLECEASNLLNGLLSRSNRDNIQWNGAWCFVIVFCYCINVSSE